MVMETTMTNEAVRAVVPVSTDVLERLYKVLRTCSDLARDAEAVDVIEAVDAARRDVAALWHKQPNHVPSRVSDSSTSVDEAQAIGFALGRRCAAQYSTGLTIEEDRELVAEAVHAKRAKWVNEFLEPSDPEYIEMLAAFDRGIEKGILRYFFDAER